MRSLTSKCTDAGGDWVRRRSATMLELMSTKKRGPVRNGTPVEAMSPTVGANCHRYLTSDATGWLRGDILGNDGAPKRVGDERGEDEQGDVPRFGTLTAEVKSLLLLVSL